MKLLAGVDCSTSSSEKYEVQGLLISSAVFSIFLTVKAVLPYFVSKLRAYHKRPLSDCIFALKSQLNVIDDVQLKPRLHDAAICLANSFIFTTGLV